MKQSLLFMWMLIIASAFSLSSCSSDDDDSGLSQKRNYFKSWAVNDAVLWRW